MVKSSNVSKRISTNMVPLIVSFFAGFIVNRLMNHQDVITGDVTEGSNGTPPLIFIVVCCVGVVLVVGGLYEAVRGEAKYLRNNVNMLFSGVFMLLLCSIVRGVWLIPRHEDGQLSGDANKWIIWSSFGLVICLFIVFLFNKNFSNIKSLLTINANTEHTDVGSDD